MPVTSIIQIRDGCIVQRYEPLFRRQYSNSFRRREIMNDARHRGTYTGEITTGARKRLQKVICLMCQATPAKWIVNPVTNRIQHHQISFITLTIPDPKPLTSKEGYKRLLRPFIKWLTRTKNVKMYLWKAEFQERGQLHYHLTIPDFIHYKQVATAWNAILTGEGLNDKYAKTYGHFQAPSTEIRETRNIRKMSNYMIKELGKSVYAKKVKAQAIGKSLMKAGEIDAERYKTFVDECTGDLMKNEGRVWGCSENLAAAKYFEIEECNEHSAKLTDWMKRGYIKEVATDAMWWSILAFKNGLSPPDLLNLTEKKNMSDHFEKIINRPAIETTSLCPLEIPAECVSSDIDVMKTYTWEQMQLFLN